MNSARAQQDPFILLFLLASILFITLQQVNACLKNSDCDEGYYCNSMYMCTPNGQVTCDDGRYCPTGYYCGKHHDKCFPFGSAECKDFEGRCDSDHYCGKTQCIPKGMVECPSGNHCLNESYYCSKYHPGTCYPFGSAECKNFKGSCDSEHYCGKTHCIPKGKVECKDGDSCLLGRYCSKDSKRCIQFGSAECKDFEGSCDSDHYCGKTGCIPKGKVECPSGNHCLNESYYCSKHHPGTCYPFGSAECKDFDGSCDSDHYCGKTSCISKGKVECENGNTCAIGYYCSKHHPRTCFPFGEVECKHFRGSCGDGFFCGRAKCVPIGHVECADGRICDQNHFCSNATALCIPRGHVECPGTSSDQAYCALGEHCVHGFCLPTGRHLCEDNTHHCANGEQVCDPTFSVVNPTVLTLGCLPVEVSECDAYKKFEEKAECGPEGYLMKHGYHYCRRFYAHFYMLGQAEQKVLKCISQCLVHKVGELVNDGNDAEQQATPSCDQIGSKARRRVHMPCYRQCNICSINSNDPFNPIWKIIDAKLITAEERESVARMCRNIRQNGQHAANEFVEEDGEEDE